MILLVTKFWLSLCHWVTVIFDSDPLNDSAIILQDCMDFIQNMTIYYESSIRWVVNSIARTIIILETLSFLWKKLK